jgi:proteasome lid subunit RPN8/RPN11
MLRVSQDCLEQTLAHLRAVLPHEGIGLWVGRRGWVRQVWPLENIHATPQLRYEANPQALLEALRKMETTGLELVAIYHSHPTGPAQPSEADRQEAFWRVPYVIFALQTGDVRAFLLPESEEVVVVVEAAVG